MHIHPLISASLGVAGVVTGRLLLNRWFNHLSIYSLIWGTSLTLFGLRWVAYRPVPAEIWLLMGYAWIAFAMGTVSLVFAKAAIGDSPLTPAPSSNESGVPVEPRILLRLLVILSAVALVGVMTNWSALLKRFGSVTNVLLSGSIIYTMRVTEKIPGTVPYLDSLGLPAAFFAGLYCARVGRLKVIALVPLVIIFFQELVEVARAKLVATGIIFVSAYFIAKVGSKSQSFSSYFKWKRLLPIAFALIILIAGSEFIRGMRGGGYGFYGMSKKFPDIPLLSPSVYLYLSANPAGLSAYWEAGGENAAFPGSNTFQPFYRILIRLGIAEDEPRYPKFYNTPVMINTGTYLRELYTDFGITGILVFPYLLGFVCTLLWLKAREHPRVVYIALLSHLYVVVIFSFLLQASRWGFWAESLIVSLLIGGFVDWQCYTGKKISQSLG